MIILGMIFFLASFAAVQGQDCDTIQTDSCGQLVWPFLVDTTKTPSNEVEKQETCVQIREGEKCTREYLERCPNVIKKENAEDLLDSFNVTIADFCDGALGKRFLPYGACLKKNLGNNFTCHADAITRMEAAAVSEPISSRLELSCCAYLEFDKCFKDVTTAACDRRAARAIRNLVQSYAIFMVEKCIGFVARPGRCDLSALKGLTPKNGRKTTTPFPALFDVISTTF